MSTLQRATNSPKFLDPLQFTQPLKLDIGSGELFTDSRFTTVDLFVEANIQATMWDIPLPDGTVDEIYSNNSLEHVSKKEVVPTLREWHRLLKQDGKLLLIVPDLEWACAWWLDHQETDWSMDIIYGHQAHDGEYHRTGFTPKILWNYFVEANPGGWFVNKIEYSEGEMREIKETSPGVFVHDIVQRIITLEAKKV
jgi:predicted SAM-dependent methyltransferase